MENRNNSSLLINESPLCVQPSLAVAIGLNEAIFLQQCHYWLNPKFNINIIDGKHWVHKTLQQWAGEFPFWGEKTIRRVISNLENLKIVISNVTTNGFKKTKFFTIDYDALDEHTSSKPAETLGADPCGQYDQIDLPKRADGSGQNDHIEVVNMTRSYKEERLLTEITTLSPSKQTADSSSAKDEREKDSLSEKMISTWNDMIPEKAQRIPSKQLHCNLERALREQLGGNIESWKEVCENFSSSKFLMGEAEGISFIPSLSWLLDPQKPLVARVFAKEHYIFDDRTLAAKPIQDLEAIEKEIESSSEVKIVKDIRLFVLQSNPGFYVSYLKQSKFDVGGEGVQLRAGSSFAKEKISEAFFEKMNTFLKEKYQMSLELQ